MSTAVGGGAAIQSNGANLHTDIDNFPATQPVSGTVAVSNFPATQPVSGTVSVLQSTSPWVTSGTITSNQGTSPWVVSGTVTANQGGSWTVSATQSGSWTTGRTWTLASGTDSITTVPSGTQTISGTVTANQGGSWTVSSTQSGVWTTGRTWTLASGTDSVTTVPSGTQTVSGTVSATQGTSPWVVSGTITPAGGVVDATNSTTANLGANGVFTGTSVSVLGYAGIEVIIYSNAASAAGGLLIEFSTDGTNWDDASAYTFTPGVAGPNQGQSFIAAARGQFYRVVYTNSATPQTTFRMQSVLKIALVGGDVVAISTTPTGTNHGLLTLSQIIGLTTGGGGGYVPVKVNPSGALVGDFSNSSNVGVTGTFFQSTQPVSLAAPTAVRYGQTTVAVTNTAVQLASNVLTGSAGVIIQALAANVNNVVIGDASVTTGNGFQLQPGQATAIDIDNVNRLYVNGTAGDGVCFLGS